MRVSRIKIAMGLSLLAIWSPVSAQDLDQVQSNQPRTAAPAPPTKPQPIWLLTCATTDTGFDCRGGQTRFVKNQRVLSVAVHVPPDKKPTLMIQPHFKIYVPAGATLQIGKGPSKAVPVKTCDQNGCVAEYPLAEADLAAMLKGGDLTIEVQTMDQQPQSFTVPVAGFPAVYAKIR